MSLLINASNLYVGGGVQVAISVLDELIKNKTKFIAAISPVIASQLAKETLTNCIIIKSTPSNLLNISVRKQLDNIVIEYNITKVFTIFGPSYWTPKNVKHAVGFALPWLIYDTHYIFKKLKFREKMKTLLLSWLQPYYFKKNADLIFVETDDVGEKLAQIYNFPRECIVTVPNTINEILKNSLHYDDSIMAKLPKKTEGDFYLLTISHDYPHKNLSVIPELIKLLPSNYKFIITVDSDFSDKVSSAHRGRLINIGPVPLNQCAALYKYCDALFLPTLLECFSSSYVEAMYFKKTILTSNLSFAHAICKNSAIYFNPYDVFDIKEKIESGFESEELRTMNIKNADELLTQFPTAAERVKLYLDNINNLR